jgi:CheY-like chemotaxis protein
MPPLLALVDDLMFLSRIREAARGLDLEVRALRAVADLAGSETARIVIVDLDSPRLPWRDALAAFRADPRTADVPVVGFVSHVETERARDARAAGCTRVLARSAFVQQLPELLTKAAG